MKKGIFLAKWMSRIGREKIKIIVESQPRSGTHYSIDNLSKCYLLDYASIFPNEIEVARELYFTKGHFFKEGFLFSTRSENSQGYILKTHFHKTANLSEKERNKKVLYLLAYFFDSYYSWGWQLSAKDKKKFADYILHPGSREWARLEKFLDWHSKWLEELDGRFLIRYEDYHLKFEEILERIQNKFGEFKYNCFSPAKPQFKRTYFNNKYSSYFDEAIFNILKDRFYPYIRKYYPEKIDSI